MKIDQSEYIIFDEDKEETIVMDKYLESTINRWFKKIYDSEEVQDESTMKIELANKLAELKKSEQRNKMINRNAFKTSVQRKVDGDIVKHLQNHQPITSLQSELTNRITGMRSAIEKINPNRDIDFVISTFKNENWMLEINSTREEYFFYYIYFLQKRVRDLQWILSNRFKGPQIKFSHLFNDQIFKLIKLRERLDPKEEALVM